MASDFDANAARASLGALGKDRAQLAQRFARPRWYHPVVALLTAAAAVSPALPVPWSWIVPAVFVVLISVLPSLARRGGVSHSEQFTGPASRRLLSAQVVIFLVLLVCSAAVRTLDWPWWLLPIIAAVAFFSILLLGLAYDRARRHEISGRGDVLG